MSESRSRGTAAEQNWLAPRPLNLGLETTTIGASSRSLAPRARGLGQAPRLRAAGAGEQCSQSLHRRAVDARADEELTSTTTTMRNDQTAVHHVCTQYDSADPWLGSSPGPGRPSLSRVRARGARARARADVDVDVSLSLSPALAMVSALSQRQSGVPK